MLFIKILIYDHILPNSQRLPTNPFRQEHLPPMHQPPFKHGSESEQSRTEGTQGVINIIANPTIWAPYNK